MNDTEEELTLRCPNPACPQETFTITVNARKGDKEKLIEQIYRCPYCDRQAVYKIPEIFTEEATLFREITGEPR